MRRHLFSLEPAIQNMFRVGDAFDAAGVVTGPRPAELDDSNHGKEPIQIAQASFTPALPRLPNQDQEVLSLRPVRSEHNFFEDNVMEVNDLIISPREYELEERIVKDVDVKEGSSSSKKIFCITQPQGNGLETTVVYHYVFDQSKKFHGKKQNTGEVKHKMLTQGAM
ncbi:hypothetical protein AC249_AIPGENE26313 [Exaiptasia diaphana]|nr:hypothetical protein AC249_AIPGENE26313 [Exaiptasia diaphana]